MEDLLNKEPVKRVSQKLKEFDEALNVVVLDSSARTAQDAADSLNTEVGSIIKSLAFNAKNGPLEPFLSKVSRKTFSIAGKMKFNEWRGNKSIEFVVEDISIT